jgi:D-beta-D-heptose 7-phosphate kinase/D-beta-D-heptose 1-phosphate adenosyltransferase
MHKTIQSLRNKKVLLLGDTIIDHYMHGTSQGTALGTNVSRVQETQSVMNFGGCSFIAANVCELGGKVIFVSVVGADEESNLYKKFVHKNLTKHFFVDPSRRTTIKRRIFADGTRVLHFNSVDNHYLSKTLERKVFSLLKKLIREVDVVVVMDAQHGFLSRSLARKLVALTNAASVPLLIDAQISHRKSNHQYYREAFAVFLNEKEAKAVDARFDMSDLKGSLKRIQKKFKLKNVVIKLGEKGSASLFGDEFFIHKGVKVVAVDPVGAGDAFLAAFSLGEWSQLGNTFRLANTWAALSTTLRGTSIPKKKALLSFVKKIGA